MDYARLLFSFSGRINRARFLVVQLALLTAWFMVWLKLPHYFSSPWETWVLSILMIWINTATTVRRLHDRNRSGWWALAIFVVNRMSYMYYGLFFGSYFGVDISTGGQLLLVMLVVALSFLQTGIFIELFFVIGTDGPNRFGPDPTRSAPNSPIDSHAGPVGVPDFLVLRAGPSLHS
jgi:uncharacterized membrane protein YhaH (DUF805 family)